MRRLNNISTMFVTELIDIITPQLPNGLDSKKTDSTVGSGSHDNNVSIFQDEESINLCLVLDFIETDLDQIMKR